MACNYNKAVDLWRKNFRMCTSLRVQTWCSYFGCLAWMNKDAIRTIPQFHNTRKYVMCIYIYALYITSYMKIPSHSSETNNFKNFYIAKAPKDQSEKETGPIDEELL